MREIQLLSERDIPENADAFNLIIHLLAEQNRFLMEWESQVADTRIHGTTRKQVKKAFEEVEKPALLALPTGRFPLFAESRHKANRDGHIEVAKAYYPALFMLSADAVAS